MNATRELIPWRMQPTGSQVRRVYLEPEGTTLDAHMTELEFPDFDYSATRELGRTRQPLRHRPWGKKDKPA